MSFIDSFDGQFPSGKEKEWELALLSMSKDKADQFLDNSDLDFNGEHPDTMDFEDIRGFFDRYVDVVTSIGPETKGATVFDDRVDLARLEDEGYWNKQFADLAAADKVPGKDLAEFKAKVKRMSTGVAAVIPKNRLVRYEMDEFETFSELILDHHNKETQNLTWSQSLKRYRGRFGCDPAIARGSAFLVGDKYLISAAHNFITYDLVTRYDFALGGNRTDKIFRFKTEEEMKEVYFAFDFQTTGDGKRPSFTDLKIVSGKLVPGMHKLEPMNDEPFAKFDWALIELEEGFPDRWKFKPNHDSELKEGDSLFTFGFPGGVPMKFTPGGTMVGSATTSFHTTLDTFSGNSGGPVLNVANMKLEGILISGKHDYNLINDSIQSREYQWKHYVDGVAGEVCQSLAVFWNQIAEIIN